MRKQKSKKKVKINKDLIKDKIQRLYLLIMIKANYYLKNVICTHFLNLL